MRGRRMRQLAILWVEGRERHQKGTFERRHRSERHRKAPKRDIERDWVISLALNYFNFFFFDFMHRTSTHILTFQQHCTVSQATESRRPDARLRASNARPASPGNRFFLRFLKQVWSLNVSPPGTTGSLPMSIRPEAALWTASARL